MSNQLQYIRRCNLVVSGVSGDGLDLSNLRIVFKIKKSDAQTPNTAEIRVYNLAPETAKQIRKEFKRVVLQAGYESNYGVIFDGNIKQVRMGRESGTDTYIDIAAGDGDDAYNYAVVNTTLAAGAKQSDQITLQPVPCQAKVSAKGSSQTQARLLSLAAKSCTETHATTCANRLRPAERLGLFKTANCNLFH